jgi:hypothetical protein
MTQTAITQLLNVSICPSAKLATIPSFGFFNSLAIPIVAQTRIEGIVKSGGDKCTNEKTATKTAYPKVKYDQLS